MHAAIEGYTDETLVKVFCASLSLSTFEIARLAEDDLMLFLICNRDGPEWAKDRGTAFCSAEKAEEWKRLALGATGVIRDGDDWYVVKKDRRML